MRTLKPDSVGLFRLLPFKMSATTLLWLTLFILCVLCLFAADDAMAAGTVDPAAPLEMLKTARSKAAASNLTQAQLTTGAGNIANMILIAMGVLGVGAASYSGYSLYNNIQQGEQARGSNMTYTVALVAGSMLTLTALIIGVVTNFVSA